MKLHIIFLPIIGPIFVIINLTMNYWLIKVLKLNISFIQKIFYADYFKYESD